MLVLSLKSIRSIGVFAVICSSLASASAQSATSKIVNAANTFISSLDEKQKQGVLFPFNDETQRANWSNLPVSFAKRAASASKK